MSAPATAEITIGQLSRRTGVASSALRYYDAEGLISSSRTPSGQRRFSRDTIRRVSFIRIAQEVGLTLTDIRDALASLPDHRTPTHADWELISSSWRPMLDARIRLLERLRDRLDGCIGCGCLSLDVCKIVNPDDYIASHGAGPRTLIEDD